MAAPAYCCPEVANVRLKKSSKCTMDFERSVRTLGFFTIAGVDEAGRGCLLGPVFAAAVILNPERPIRGLDDSKALDASTRETLAPRIRERAVAWAVASATAAEVDRINILQASRLAMRRAVEQLAVPADYLLVDATTVDLPVPQRAIIRGDALSRSIAAASILAKTSRDALLQELDLLYPGYGLASNKGYGSPIHLDALDRLGPTPEHRMTYAPVRQRVQRTLFEETGA
ncbi:MAG TPA: ribonuclease HII [Bryobacteraceae bacterium]|nr:ribonuclease HII [Bryobacteraceae bacterium]